MPVFEHLTPLSPFLTNLGDEDYRTLKFISPDLSSLRLAVFLIRTLLFVNIFSIQLVPTLTPPVASPLCSLLHPVGTHKLGTTLPVTAPLKM
jgi:hypothetical protein